VFQLVTAPFAPKVKIAKSVALSTVNSKSSRGSGLELVGTGGASFTGFFVLR
jgi:hypothetical protein